MRKNDFLSKVNAVPRGLQNLLGNINQGVNPHNLDPTISPVVDMYPFWANSKILSIQAAGSIAGTVGQYVAIEVPEGELWHVLAASCAYDNDGTTTDDTSVSLAILNPDLATSVAFYHSNYNLNVPGAPLSHQIAGGPFPDKFILSGGWNIIGQVNGSSITTVREMTVQALYVKLTE